MSLITHTLLRHERAVDRLLTLFVVLPFTLTLTAKVKKADDTVERICCALFFCSFYIFFIRTQPDVLTWQNLKKKNDKQASAGYEYAMYYQDRYKLHSTISAFAYILCTVLRTHDAQR